MARAKKSQLAIARDDWFDSTQGKIALDTAILRSAADIRFLRNRLELAFLAGAKAQKQIDKEGA